MECFQPVPVTHSTVIVYHWTHHGNERKPLSIEVYPDDTVLRLLTKIAYAMGKTRVPYAWTTTPLLFTPSGEWHGYHVNPWKSVNRQLAKDSPKLTFRFNDLIESSTLNLNVTFFDDVPEELQNEYYFPSLGVKIQSKASVEKEEAFLSSLWLGSVSDTVTHGMCSYANVSFSGRIKKTDLLLADIFAKASGTKSIPFIQWVDDRTRVLYKLYSQHTIPVNVLQTWTDYTRLPVLEDAINMYATFKNTYVRCSISSRGEVQVTYKLDSRDKIALEEVNTDFVKLSQYLQSIVDSKISFSMSDLSLRTELYKSDVSLKSFGAVLTTALPVFHITDLTANNLTVVYKRSSNYNTIDITESIRGLLKFGNIPVEEVVQRIMTTYGFALSEAKSYVDQAALPEDAAVAKKMQTKVETGVLIQISPIALGFRITMDQVPSLYEARCALHWLYSCLHASKKTKGKVLAKPVPVPTKTTSPPLSSKSSSIKKSSEKSLSKSLSIGGAIGKEYQGYFLRMLQAADPKIFVDNGNYARMCMVTNYRQPVVISKKEKAELDKSEFGKGIDNFMEYGSDPQNPNVYFCPRIWCPESKVPMTYEQYQEYKVCPKGEAPIMMYDHSYWDKDPNVKHNIGFHSEKGENGLCLPCCMKREKKPVAFDKKLKECAVPGVVDTVPQAKTVKKKPSKDEVPDSVVKEEYYLMTQGAPLQEGRYGTVPKPLHNALFPQISHAMCSKVLTSQECLVRKGIDHGNDSLMAAISSSLGLTSKDQLVSLIKKKVDPLTFLTLEHGHIVTLFAPEHALIPSEHASMVKRWKAWIDKFPKYTRLFGLQQVIDKKVSELDDEQKLVLSRELSVFDAYERFMKYLKSAESKNPYLLYDVMHHLDVLLLLWEKQDNDNAYLYCPFYTSKTQLLDALASAAKTILLMKDGEYYEPLELKQRNKNGVATIPFSSAQRMIDILHSCNGKDDDHRAVVASILSYNMWVERALIVPSQFRIQTLVVSPALKITHGITKSNILIRFPQDGIPLGYLSRIMADLNIRNLVHHEDIEGNTLSTRIVATDLQVVGNYLSKIGFGYDAGSIVSSVAVGGAFVYETVITVPPCIEFPTLKTLESYSSSYKEKDKKWHQLQMLVGKTFLGHYETLVMGLGASMTRQQKIETLMNTFPKIQDRDMLKAVIEEMPIEYGNKAEFANWLRRVSYPQKYPFLDGNIQKKQSQYIFSQVAVEQGLPWDVIHSAKGPRPSHAKAPNMSAQEERGVVPSNVQLNSTGLPSDLRVKYEQLPSKWTQIKSYEWAAFKMASIEDYNATSIWKILEWLSTKLMMPATKEDLIWLRNKTVNMSLKDSDLMSIYMEDPSFLLHWNEAFNKKHGNGKHMMEKAYIPAMKKPDTLTSLWKGIVDKGSLWPSHIDLFIFTKVVQCSILLLHRSPYGEGNKKRGDIEDLGISSTFYTNEYTDSYVGTKPLVIFYCVKGDTHTEYRPIIDASGTFLHKSVNLSPKDVRDLISYHIQHKTNKMK